MRFTGAFGCAAGAGQVSQFPGLRALSRLSVCWISESSTRGSPPGGVIGNSQFQTGSSTMAGADVAKSLSSQQLAVPEPAPCARSAVSDPETALSHTML